MTRIDLSRVGVVAAIAAAIALGGCGSKNPVGSRPTAEFKLAAISSDMEIAMTANPYQLPDLTNDYIAVVWDSETALGANVAKQRLTTTAMHLSYICSRCAQRLNAAAAQIG